MVLLGRWNWWAPAPLRRLRAQAAAPRATAPGRPAIGATE
jgi:hypothetical protein